MIQRSARGNTTTTGTRMNGELSRTRNRPPQQPQIDSARPRRRRPSAAAPWVPRPARYGAADDYRPARGAGPGGLEGLVGGPW